MFVLSLKKINKKNLKSANSSEKVDYGCTEKEFKTRYYNHKQSFKLERNKHAPSLSKAV